MARVSIDKEVLMNLLEDAVKMGQEVNFLLAKRYKVEK